MIRKVIEKYKSRNTNSNNNIRGQDQINIKTKSQNKLCTKNLRYDLEGVRDIKSLTRQSTNRRTSGAAARFRMPLVDDAATAWVSACVGGACVL